MKQKDGMDVKFNSKNILKNLSGIQMAANGYRYTQFEIK